MAHELEMRTDGTAAAVYARVPAWHGLGIVFPDDNALTLEQVLDAVPELATDVDLVPLQAVLPDGKVLPTGAFATVRRGFKRTLTPDQVMSVGGFLGADPDAELIEINEPQVLGVGLSKEYRVMQNRAALQILQDVVDESGAIFEAAGTLRDGKQAWILARLPDEILIGGDKAEAHVPYLMATNSFDGSLAVGLHSTFTRVVCANTVRIGVNGAKSSFRIRHTESMEGRVAEARAALGLVFAHTELWAAEMERLVTIDISDGDVEEFLAKLLPVKASSTPSMPNSVLNRRSVIRDMYLHTPDLDNVRGTAYGLLQATADFADHRLPVKQESRFRAAMLGDGSLTEAAHKILTQVAS